MINHLMCIDDIKLFAKIEEELKTDTGNIQPGYRNRTGHKKCALLKRKSGERHIMEGIEQLN